MKRVKAACICQTLHFILKEDVDHDYAVRQVEQAVEQYNSSPVGNYLNQTLMKACSLWRKSSKCQAIRFIFI